MMRLVSTAACLAVLFSTASLAQIASDEERRWLAEHPEALTALGNLSREELGQFLETYQDLTPAEKAQLRENAGELQKMSPADRSWALQNPDAVRQLGAMPEEDRKKFLDAYGKLTPAEQEKLRARAGELQQLSPEERRWALDNPEAARDLGNLPDDQREQMMEAYRGLDPATQRAVRDQMGR